MSKVNKFLEAQVLDQYMFGWVVATRKAFPACSIEKALTEFKKYFCIEDIEFNILSKKRQFIRMQEDFNIYLKTDVDTGVN